MSPTTDKNKQRASTGDSKEDPGRRTPAGHWRRITAGLELQDLWTQFKQETREGYRVSSREVDWQSIEHKNRPARIATATREIIVALFMKLTPARRVFLLVALIFVLLSFGGDRTAG